MNTKTQDRQSAGPLRVVILGGGTAGWMAAAGLASQLPPRDYAITLIELDEIGTVGVGEATLPQIKQFNDMLGLNEAEVLRATQATFKLGIEFRDWDLPGSSYIHPFGTFGEPWGGIGFQHHWLRAKALGRDPGPLDAYSFAVMAARANRCAMPDADPRAIGSTFSYAYHFDAALYAGYLRDRAIGQGVTRIEGRMCAAERDGESGHLTALTLASGQRITGDFFLDCSGFRSLLLAGEFGGEWEDWSHWLPCDRAFAVPSAHGEAFLPYTRATARLAGWTWRIPLQHRVGNGYVFSSRHIEEDAARAALLASLEAKPLAEPRLLRFAPGRRRQAWTGNCVAIGLAGGFLEPLELTSIFLIQTAVTDLARLMPRAPGRADPALVDEFNRFSDLQYARIRDFLILHYAANRRFGEPLWDHARTMELPETLVHKLALFRKRATLPDYRHGLFSRESWLSVLVGQGIEPNGFDPLAETVPLDALVARLDDLRERIAAGVAAMPDHARFVRDYCCAEPQREGLPA
ncbi:tryptophan halogenase family protein [Novosphingobium sp. BL-8A]|uniref:tryptophan halogenase family protein n=1 Tax=Novosphingobium sp. BL-8A TaxID=3127639 RepID=UPI003757FE0E